MASLILVGCGDSVKDRVNSDEVHLHQDWKSKITGVILLDTVNDEWNTAKFVEVSSSSSIQDLSDLLFELAFSGDAEVLAPDIFGVIDTDSKLNPDELLEELRFVDTTSVEDLQTGIFRDTVIDLSFTQEQVSAVRVFCSIDQNTMELFPTYVAMGSQVFDHESGAFRGFNYKFYVKVGDEKNIGRSVESLIFQTDSVGVFQPTKFLMHSEDSDVSISDYARDQFGSNVSQVECSLDLQFDNSNMRLYVEHFQLSPIEQPL